MDAYAKLIRTRGRMLPWFAIVLALALVLGACAPPTIPTATPETRTFADTPAPATEEPTQAPTLDLDQVYDQLWVLVALGPQDNPLVVERGTVVTAQFAADGTVSGSSGCNSYNGGFEIAPDGTVTVTSPFASTMMACEQGMEQEQAYLAALGSAQSLTINAEGRLVVNYDTGTGETEALVYTPGETPLTGTIWTLISYGDPSSPTNVEAGTTVTALFDETNMTGSSGCNSFTAAYTVEGDQMSIGPAATTRMACPSGMEQEAAFLASLEGVSTYQITGSQMTLANEAGDDVLLFTAANLPLESTLWTLVALNGQSLAPEIGLTALFEPGEEANAGVVAGSAGCNNYFGSYTLDGDQITISEIGSTLMLCESGMDVEQSYLNALESAESFEILGRTLELTTAEGTLTYVADRTPLQGALWVLTGMGSTEEPAGPVDGANFTAQFTRNSDAPTGVVSGTTGCTEYSSAFAANLTEIRINPPLVGDTTTCSSNVALQQTEYFTALAEATTYSIVGNVMRIPYGDGNALVFTGTQLEVAGRLPLTNLNGTRWFLNLINDQALAPGTEINASFTVDESGESGTMSGSSGCNAYSATFGLDLGVVATLTSNKVCSQPPGVMDQEQTYINALNRAYGYWLTDNYLIINTGLGALTYLTTPPNTSRDQAHLLQNKTWFLTSYGSTESVAGSAEPTLSFNANGAVSGNTGCNALTGNYTTDVQNIRFSNLLVGSANCPNDAASQQQQAFVAALNSSQTYQVVENTMQLVASSGVLNFSTTPPDRVEPIPTPVAVINGPTQATVGETVTFDASKSTSEAPVTEYRWNMGDGSILFGVTVQYGYSTPGTYEVALRVYNDQGDFGRSTQNITIVAAPATPQPTAIPQPTATPQPTAIPQPTATPETPATPGPTATPEPTAIPEPTATPEPPEQTPPTAAVTGSATGFVAEPVSFSGSGSTAGSSPIVSYAWNFGDGSSAAASPNPDVTTLYSKSGTYTVVLTVTDQNGLTSSASQTIVVSTRIDGPVWVYSPQPPLIGGTAITLQFARGSFTGFSGCNTYNGGYTATDNGDGTYTVSVTGITSTQIACPQNVMDQEQAYLEALQSTTLGAVSGNVLTLTTGSGTLTFYESGSPVPR